MVQTAYSENMAAAVAGMLADAGQNDVVSMPAQSAITAGAGLTLHSGGVTVEPANSTAAFQGVAVRSLDTEGDANNDPSYAATDVVSVLRKGRIWVSVQDAVGAGAAAFVDNAGAGAGEFRSDATGGVAVPTGVFRTTTAGAGLAILEINLP